MAWYNPPSLRMHRTAELKIWQEVRKGFINLKNHHTRPDIIILPELTIPAGNENDLKTLCKEIGAVVIAGLDFTNLPSNRVKNEALVIVPNRWPDDIRSRRVSSFKFGKTHPSEEEKILFTKLNHHFEPEPHIYIFNAGHFGNIGVAICSDFFDIERFVLYRGHIHHMIVISHNMDTKSYYFLAEAIARLVYCNVVICNTGQYGDSLAFAPYSKDYKRIIYRHAGQELFTTQVVALPVHDLDDAQKGNDRNKIFKARPPGY